MTASIKIISQNKKARFHYTILETIESGICLTGTEVRSLRETAPSLEEAFVEINKDLEAFLLNAFIAPFKFGNIFNHEEKRKRKLLLHKKQICLLKHKISSQGMAIVPLKLYFKNNKVKVELALGKGKNLYDKRQSEKEKDIKRKLREGNFS